MAQYAPAGWSPQPDGTERWWDGQTWTAHSRPVPPPPIVPMVEPKNPGVSLIASFFVPVMVDAYQGAQQWNRRHGILS